MGFSFLEKNPDIGNCALCNTKSPNGSKGCEMRKLVLAVFHDVAMMDKQGSVPIHCPKFDELPGTKFRKNSNCLRRVYHP